MVIKEYLSQSIAQTHKIAADLAEKTKGNAVFCLYGNLGSGKTTFTQGFAKALGVRNNIPSPTFVLIRQYQLNDERILYHVDLYRLGDKDDVKGLGLSEIMKEKKTIIVIEWAEKAKNLLPEKRIDIFFEYLDDTTRKIRVRSMYGK